MRFIAVVYHHTYNNIKSQIEVVIRGIQYDSAMNAGQCNIDDGLLMNRAWRNGASDLTMVAFVCQGGLLPRFKSFIGKDGDLRVGQTWSNKWRNKLAVGFTSSDCASGNNLQILSQWILFAAQRGMSRVRLGLLPANIDNPDDEYNLDRLGGSIRTRFQRKKETGALYSCDLNTAEHLGRRVAEAVLHTQAVAHANRLIA